MRSGHYGTVERQQMAASKSSWRRALAAATTTVLDGGSDRTFSTHQSSSWPSALQSDS